MPLFSSMSHTDEHYFNPLFHNCLKQDFFLSLEFEILGESVTTTWRSTSSVLGHSR